ncbi:hypothetical protein CAEBREN_22333 [Caenorhabditis brenneri]|uniref:DUF7038 domain-containing protein n=1 Tax=Caenorhabditis brenneri TaxID=135651 RepID=G0P2T8_CAEBE|nr:hypothetical protein CAEBREN_22333 [Caenorhabditis brenneri]
MNNRKLDAQFSASKSPQDPSHSPIPEEHNVAMEPVSAAPGRVLASEHHHPFRYDPYPARNPVRGPRDVVHNFAAHANFPVVHMWNRQSPERHDLERPSFAELLNAAGQLLGFGQNPERPMPVRGPVQYVEHNPIAPRFPAAGRLAGRLSFAPPQHNAGLVAPENPPAPRLLPDALGNLPPPHQFPDVEVRRLHPRIQAPERDQEDQQADPFEHWPERFAYAHTIHGMVCMVEKDQIKLFNFKRRYMHIIPNNLEVSPKLYQYIRMTERSFVTIGNEYVRDIIEYISNTGQILTWATSPNAEEIAQMSKETREMFQGKIWSPRLGYLADPDRKFNPQFNGKEAWICAKYAPTEEAHFQIVKTYSEREGEERFVDTPWMRMILGMYFDEADHDFVIPSGSSRRLRHGGFVEHAVCIATDVRNLQYKKRRTGDLKKDGGSKERCSIFFNRLFGIYRCLKPAELGSWYSHNSIDARASKKKNKGHLSVYRAVTVGRMRPVDAPLPTQVREGRVQMTIEFEIKSLEQLSFIWDKYVGKVMIDIIFWTFITNMVKLHHKNEAHNGKSAFYKELVKKGITIRALALTRDNYETANEYPTNGAFILGTVFLIKYKETNEIIFQKVE